MKPEHIDSLVREQGQYVFDRMFGAMERSESGWIAPAKQKMPWLMQTARIATRIPGFD